MDAYGNRDDSDAQDSHRLSQISLLSFRSLPPKGKGFIEPSPAREPIPEKGNVRNHEYRKEYIADNEVGRDAGKIPKEWRLELRMESHPVE
jgi:hypothetical protein